MFSCIAYLLIFIGVPSFNMLGFFIRWCNACAFFMATLCNLPWSMLCSCQNFSLGYWQQSFRIAASCYVLAGIAACLSLWIFSFLILLV